MQGKQQNYFLEFQKIRNHLELLKKGKILETWKNLKKNL